ncbi:MAG: M14 family metallopeptidase [Bacillota bacterium]
MKKACVLLALVFLLAGCTPGSPLSNTQSPASLKPSLQTAVQTDAVNPNQTYSYAQMMEDAQELARLYPGLVDVSSIGKSVEGRDIPLIRLGKGSKKIILLGAHHAREYMTSTFLMETADEYARAYASGGKFGGYDIQKLLNGITVYIVPMVNPDGVNLVQNGPDSAKNTEKVRSMRMLQDSYDEWKANINGVDLNRQYPCHWEEKASATDVPSSEMYKGTAPATEPEVQAVIGLCKAQDFVLAVSFHTKGEVIYWADSGTQDAIPAGSRIAQALGEVSGYKLMPVSEDPSVYGAGFENWFRQDFKRPAFCIELTPTGNGSAPYDDALFDKLIWKKAKTLCATLMQQADELAP